MNKLIISALFSVLLGIGLIVSDNEGNTNQYSPEKAKIMANGEISTMFYYIEPDDYTELFKEGGFYFQPSANHPESIAFLLNAL